MQERFGDRLVLRQHWGEKAQSITDRVVKHAKQNQLNPESEDKWGHDRYDGPTRKRQDRYESPDSVPIEEEDLERPHRKNNDMNKVLVKNLPNDLSNTQVKEIFTRYGEVIKAQVDDGVAIVTFADNEGALQAHYINTHKKMLKINGNPVKVTIIEPED